MELVLRDKGTLHYEIHGDAGEWVIFLNGIIMTTKAWEAYIPLVSRHHRLLLVDFRDQGRSSAVEHPYDETLHVHDLVELLDHLGIDKIHMLGVSYGGYISLAVARHYAERLKSLILVSVTAKPSEHLRWVGDSWRIAAERTSGSEFFALLVGMVYSGRFYKNNMDWLRLHRQMFDKVATPQWFTSFKRLSNTADSFDFVDLMDKIDVPTLLVCGSDDHLTTPDEMYEMAHAIRDAVMLEIPHAGHGALLEDPRALATALLGFLASQG